jgi:hypothetical protein
VLLTITKLLGFRCQVLTSSDFALGYGDSVADIEPNDVYFALAPVWVGKAMPKSQDPWDGVRSVLDKDGLVEVVKALLRSTWKHKDEWKDFVSPEERWIMRSYAIDPVGISRVWWKVDRQAQHVLGEP